MSSCIPAQFWSQLSLVGNLFNSWMMRKAKTLLIRRRLLVYFYCRSRFVSDESKFSFSLDFTSHIFWNYNVLILVIDSWSLSIKLHLSDLHFIMVPLLYSVIHGSCSFHSESFSGYVSSCNCVLSLTRWGGAQSWQMANESVGSSYSYLQHWQFESRLNRPSSDQLNP